MCFHLINNKKSEYLQFLKECETFKSETKTTQRDKKLRNGNL